MFYRWHPHWASIFFDPKYHAFDEREFSQLVVKSPEIAFDDSLAFMQGTDREARPDLKLLEDGTLLSQGNEILFYHFRRTKAWPL
jgi:hypothetical protein